MNTDTSSPDTIPAGYVTTKELQARMRCTSGYVFQLVKRYNIPSSSIKINRRISSIFNLQQFASRLSKRLQDCYFADLVTTDSAPTYVEPTSFRPFRAGDEVTLQLSNGRPFWNPGTIIETLYRKQYVFTVLKDEEENGRVYLVNERDAEHPWFMNAAFLRLERATDRPETFELKEEATLLSIVSCTGRTIALYPKSNPEAHALATAELEKLNNH